MVVIMELINSKICKSLLKLSLCLFAIFAIAGCLSTASSNHQQLSVSSQEKSASVVMDSASLFPLVGDNTSSVIDVHNYGSKSCSLNINAVTNNPSVSVNVDKNTNDQIIAPGKAVSIGFTLSVSGENKTNQAGSVSFQGTCVGDNFTQSVTQQIDFMSINNINTSGVFLTQGLVLYSLDKNYAYGDQYIYCLGDKGDSCSIDKVNTNLKIVNGDPTARSLPVGFVSRVELAAPPVQNGATSKVTFSFHINNGSDLLSSSSVGVIPSNAGTVVTPVLPLIDSSSAPKGFFTVHNPTNKSVSLNSISAPSGVNLDEGVSQCSYSGGMELSAHSSCVVYFNVAQGSAGSENIIVSYLDSSGAVVQHAVNVTYYNGNGNNNVIVAVSGAVDATLRAGDSVTTDINFTNIGATSITLNNPAISAKGNFLGTVSSSAACDGFTLLPNGQNSCTIPLTIMGNSVSNGYAGAVLSGSYTDQAGNPHNYQRSIAFNVRVIPMLPNLVFEEQPSKMTIVANGVDVLEQTINIKNFGDSVEPVTISGISLSNHPNYLTATSTACNTLSANESCAIKITLGGSPTFQALTNADLNINYTYPSGSNLLTTTVPYEVVDRANLEVTQINAPLSISGNGGSIDSKYIFSGSNLGPMTVSMTLKNSGNIPFQINHFFDNNSPVSWVLESSQQGSDACRLDESLAVNQTCNIVYNSVLGQNILAIGPNSTGTYMSQITVPQISVTSLNNGDRFLLQPSIVESSYSGSLGTIYVQNNFATLATSISQISPAESTLFGIDVQNTLSNATGYSGITIQNYLDDYFISGVESISSSSCSISGNNGVRRQDCTLTSNGSVRVIHDINQSFLLGDNLVVNLVTVPNLSDNQIIALSQSPNLSTTISPFKLTNTYMGGESVINRDPIYLAQGLPGGYPGSRVQSFSWTDKNGVFWMFGGQRCVSGACPQGSSSSVNFMNDLWKYDTATNKWTWVNGSQSRNQLNTVSQPGARSSSGAAWVDSNNNLWMFGGYGVTTGTNTSFLGDFWKYNIATNTWTRLSGALSPSGNYGVFRTESSTNIPGARRDPAVWVDKNQNLWMFGGFGFGSSTNSIYLNDLWRYNTTSGMWMWESGGSGISAQSGLYLTVGTRGGFPGGRYGASSWIDKDGNLWLFGGHTSARTVVGNDLWKYDTTARVWTWVGGSNPTTSSTPAAGTYPRIGQVGYPAARSSATTWTDKSGNVWLFSGVCSGAPHSQFWSNSSTVSVCKDLWKYTPSNNNWYFMGGKSGNTSESGVYSGSNQSIGGRYDAASWIDSTGSLWLFGGYGFASNTTYGFLGDLWRTNPVF